MTVLRPADETEVKGAWMVALNTQGPCALVLSRQSLPSLAPLTAYTSVQKGAYELVSQGSVVDVVLLATGSEVSLSLEVSKALNDKGLSVCVVSFVSFELFERQSDTYKQSVLGKTAKVWVSIEAQSSFGWHRYIGRHGLAIAQDTFGLSGKASQLASEFGFTVEAIVARILDRI